MVCILLLFACSESEEAPTVARDVQVDGSGVEVVTTDLGYAVTLSRARTTSDGLAFVRQQVLARRGPFDWLVGTAHAHPGHDGAGEVIGELPGQFAIDWLADDGRLLGTATVLSGGFDSARLTLVGAVELVGIASKEGEDFEFAVTIGFDEPTLVEGIPPIDAAGSQPIHRLKLTVREPFEGASLFDGIDFRQADLTPGGADYNRLLRAVRSHDHYLISGADQ